MALVLICGLPRTGSTALVNWLGGIKGADAVADTPLAVQLGTLRQLEHLSIAAWPPKEYLSRLSRQCAALVRSFVNMDTVGIIKDRDLLPYIDVIKPDKCYVLVRDLRSIVVSFERLVERHKLVAKGDIAADMYTRINSYFSRDSFFWRNLQMLKQVDSADVFIVRSEDLHKMRLTIWEDVCALAKVEQEPDDAIKRTTPVVYDTHMLPIGDHEFSPYWKPIKPYQEGALPTDIEKDIVNQFKWFYERYYPTVLENGTAK